MLFVLAALLFFLWLALLVGDASTSVAYLCLVASALLMIAGFTRQQRPVTQSARRGVPNPGIPLDRRRQRPA